MKAIIENKGDTSVGLWGVNYDIDTPIDENTTKEDREYFRDEMEKIYRDICDSTKVYLMFQDELDEMARQEEEMWKHESDCIEAEEQELVRKLND